MRVRVRVGAHHRPRRRAERGAENARRSEWDFPSRRHQSPRSGAKRDEVTRRTLSTPPRISARLLRATSRTLVPRNQARMLHPTREQPGQPAARGAAVEGRAVDALHRPSVERARHVGAEVEVGPEEGHRDVSGRARFDDCLAVDVVRSVHLFVKNLRGAGGHSHSPPHPMGCLALG